MSVNSPTSIVRFGTFEIDLETGELRHAGRRVKLQEQPFQVLATLLQHPGKIVTREELRSKLWPEDTFVDFDHSLNAAIKRLRDALGESADAPVYIETLARRGYRFIAPVGPGPSNGSEIAPLPERSKLLFFAHPIGNACFALMIIASVVWAVWRLPSPRADVIERKLTSNSSENSVDSAAVSPDGKYLAYSDNTGIYLKLVRTGEVHAVPLPPNFSARVDDWFPDGSRLLVSRRDEPGKASLWSISVFGGSARPLADDALAGAVSPDGAHIAFRRAELNYYDGLLGREIWVMRSDGTDQIKIDKSWSMGTPTWSPDGKRIAYVSETESSSPKISIEVNDWQNTRTETVLSDCHLTPVLHWLPDGRLIYALAVGENGLLDSSLWTISLQQSGKNSRPSKRITHGNGWITQINGTADGKTLTFLRENRAPTAFIATLAPDGTTFITHKRLTLDESLSFPTSWTPDSKAVLFSSDRNGTSEIFKQALDKPLAETLVSSAEQLTIPRLTPDGSEILYISTPQSAAPETPSSIFAIPIAGGPPRFILKDVNIWNLQCARLPSTVCMYAIFKGNAVETYRFTISGGKNTAPPQIDPRGNWSLSPDGSQRAIIPLGIEKGTIQLRPTGSGKIRTLAIKGWNELTNIDWSADGKSLLVAWHNAGKESALLKVTPEGKVSVLVRSNYYVGYAIPSPDGRLLATSEDTPTKNVWEIENFR